MKPRVKQLSDFAFLSQLKAEESSGKFSHEVRTVKKRFKASEDRNKHKYKKRWYLKTVNSLQVARLEVLAQEIFRLFYPAQPKTRAVQGKDHFFVASEAVVGDSLLEEKKTLQADILAGHATGLGKLQVLSLFTNEVDFKLGNIFKNKNNQIVKIDGDCCFWKARNQQRSSLFTEADINALPFIINYPAYNWLDQVLETKQSLSKILDSSLSTAALFRQEVNETILSILLFSEELIIKFVAYLIPDVEESYRFINILLTQKHMMLEAAANNINFRQYVAELHLDEIMAKQVALFGDFKALQKESPFADMNLALALKREAAVVFEYLEKNIWLPTPHFVLNPSSRNPNIASPQGTKRNESSGNPWSISNFAEERVKKQKLTYILSAEADQEMNHFVNNLVNGIQIPGEEQTETINTMAPSKPIMILPPLEFLNEQKVQASPLNHQFSLFSPVKLPPIRDIFKPENDDPFLNHFWEGQGL